MAVARAMVRALDAKSVGGRIVLLLAERERATERQVALALGLREDVVAREVRRLAAQGLLVVEPLGEERYVTLSGEGISLAGLGAKDRERLRARRPPPPPPRDPHDPAFG